jgi:hypothetical protein
MPLASEAAMVPMRAVLAGTIRPEEVKDMPEEVKDMQSSRGKRSTEAKDIHSIWRPGSTRREMGLVAAAEAGGSGCRDRARSRAFVVAFSRHEWRGGCAASRPIRRETLWPPIADRVQFQPTAGFNVPGIAPD